MLGDFCIFRSLNFILTKFNKYARNFLQKLFWVRFCYLTEASTAEKAVNSVQEVEKNNARKAEAVTEGMDREQQVSVMAPWTAPGTTVHPSQRKHSITGVELYPGTAVYLSCYGLF